MRTVQNLSKLLPKQALQALGAYTLKVSLPGFCSAPVPCFAMRTLWNWLISPWNLSRCLSSWKRTDAWYVSNAQMSPKHRCLRCVQRTDASRAQMRPATRFVQRTYVSSAQMPGIFQQKLLLCEPDAWRPRHGHERVPISKEQVLAGGLRLALAMGLANAPADIMGLAKCNGNRHPKCTHSTAGSHQQSKPCVMKGVSSFAQYNIISK